MCVSASFPVSTAPSRLVHELLGLREEILKDGARAEEEPGIDLHAGDDAKNNKGQPELSPIEGLLQL